MSGKLYFLIRQKNPIILSGHPYHCFCIASQSEEGSNKLKQYVARKHHVLFSTFYIASRNIIGSKNAIQYGTESRRPMPASRYLSRSSAALFLFFSLRAKHRVPAMAFAHTTATEGNCNSTTEYKTRIFSPKGKDFWILFLTQV